MSYSARLRLRASLATAQPCPECDALMQIVEQYGDLRQLCPGCNKVCGLPIYRDAFTEVRSA